MKPQSNDHTRTDVSSLRLIPLLFIFLVTLILSEFIYIAKHPPSTESSKNIFLKAAGVSKELNLASPTLYFLNIASTFRTREIAQLYRHVGWKAEKVDPDFPKKELLSTLYSNTLNTTDLSNLLNEPDSSWAKIYYDLALICFDKTEDYLGEYFLDKAAQLAPEWSYFHIELANYYLSTGNKVAAEETIKWCENFKYSKENCQHFFENNILNDRTVEIGFYKNEIHNL